MNTTSFFVELVVIGVAALIWVVLFVLSVFGFDWGMAGKMMSFQAIVPLLSIIYVLGILTDRLADTMFGRCFQSSDRDSEYYRARRIVFLRSQRLSDVLEYGRSRLRICRGWSFNAGMMVPAVNLFIWL